MSNKKIWSIPIAALAIVLMLAGALVVSGIVQAQSANIVTGDKVVILDDDDTPTTITTLTVSPSSAADPVVLGLDADQNVGGG